MVRSDHILIELLFVSCVYILFLVGSLFHNYIHMFYLTGRQDDFEEISFSWFGLCIFSTNQCFCCNFL